MHRSLCTQQNLFRKANSENESLTLVSLKVAYLLAKEGKPFMDGNIVKECMMEDAGELCPEKLQLFKMISLSRNTVARQIDNIGNNILHQITGKVQRFTRYSLTMDESTDVSDTSQLLVFVRGVDDELNVTQELASVNSMHSTTTREDIFKVVQKTLTKYNLDWNRLQGVTIDGERNMSGANNGVVGQIRKACEGLGAPAPIFLHCIIHQQALCVKYVNMSCVLKPVVSVVNFIRSHALNHGQFRSFLEQIESKTGDLSYYTAVRWLSCVKVLLQFFKLRNEINLFLAEKNHPEPLLSNAEWLWKLAFFADVVTHVNNLNLKLQGKNNLICNLFSQIKAFRAKLVLLESQLDECNFTHFPCCEELNTETDEQFPTRFAIKVIAD
ncbi:general transcription factor II-I repeat domain-containing protein 2-like [Centruroides sculpturatus]|uniref:general transcription factor II-I repeat domain-containing protein 2-like n=1 Tax=Centruroides sculpturatus TaxID=218467 RepID=UPI000C6CF2D6|nr:general transcription factor II-I repeat domain-containing protein 2-like [Centruroides sculpturatus]